MSGMHVLNIYLKSHQFPLTPAHGRSKYSPVAANSAIGIGLPDSKAHQRPSPDERRFFVALHRSGHVPASFMAGGTRGASAPPALGPVDQPVPSATLIGLGVSDSTIQGTRTMPQDTQVPPGVAPSRQIAAVFGFIADTLEWTHDDYQALIARLVGTGKSALSLTLGDILDAYAATANAAVHARAASASRRGAN